MRTIPAIVVLGLVSCTPPEGATPGGDSARELGLVNRGTCRLESLVAQVAPGCTPLRGAVVVSAGLDLEPAKAAFDGDTCRSWNGAGGAPRWVGLVFEQPETLSAVLLVVRGSGSATHVVEVDGAADDAVGPSPGGPFAPVAVLTGELRDEQAVAAFLSEPVRARELRVVTTSGASVAWREIVPLSCPAAYGP